MVDVYGLDEAARRWRQAAATLATEFLAPHAAEKEAEVISLLGPCLTYIDARTGSQGGPHETISVAVYYPPTGQFLGGLSRNPRGSRSP